MEELRDINPKQSEVEIAYQILKSGGQGKNFRALMEQVLAIKGSPLDNHLLMAAVHTQINLDNRFHFLGQGVWGLREWTQGKVVRRAISHGHNGRAVPFYRRSLTDEIEYEDGEYKGNYESVVTEEDEEWEE